MIRTPEGQEQLFWLDRKRQGLPDRGEQVEIRFSLGEDSQVLTLLTIKKL